MGITISTDLNYRKKLWKYGKNPSSAMSELVQYCDIILGNEEDVSMYFDIKPKNIDVFAGVVNYPTYNFFDKFMIRLIMWITSGPTDTKARFEFTDWERVKRFAKDLS